MNSRGVWTIFLKETARFREVWSQTLATPVVSNLLFLTIFGTIFSGGGTVDTTAYLQSLIPGLAAMGIMMNAFQNPLGSLIVAKYTNAISELMTIPLKGYEIALSYIAAAVFRGLIVGVMTVAVGFFYAHVSFAHPFLIVFFAFLLGGIFASLGAIFGAIFHDFDQMSMVQNFVVTPLIYLGGVFFPVTAIPGVAGHIAQLNPMYYLVDGFRYGFLGVHEAPLALSFAVTISFFIATFSIASWIFQVGYRLKT